MTQEQLDALNASQHNPRLHNLTCPGNQPDKAGNQYCQTRTLVATAAGWHCPGCGYTQPFHGALESLVLDYHKHCPPGEFDNLDDFTGSP